MQLNTSCGPGSNGIEYTSSINGQGKGIRISIKYFVNIIDSTSGSLTFGQTPDTIWVNNAQDSATLSCGPNFVYQWWEEVGGSGKKWEGISTITIPRGTYAIMSKDQGFYLSYDTIVVATHCTPDSITNNQTICSGDSIHVGGHYYSVTGTYYDTLTNVGGCDSIITTNLTVNPIYSQNQNLTICSGDSVVIGSHTYKVAGIYHDTLTTVNGCDSVITTNLTVNPSYAIHVDITICAGDSIIVDTHTYKNAGTYVDSMTTVNGCDSIITTQLTVNLLPIVNIGVDTVIISQGQIITLDAGTNGTSYLWSTGETTQTIDVDSAATYYVTVSNNCGSSTDSIVVVIITSTDGIKIMSNSIKVCPNPATDYIRVNGVKDNDHISIYDQSGRMMIQTQTNKNESINISNLSEGIYFIKINDLIHKIIKQ